MSGAASALFLLDMKGRVLVWKDYRGDVSASQVEKFFSKLIDRVVCMYYSPFLSSNNYIWKHSLINIIYPSIEEVGTFTSMLNKWDIYVTT